MSYVDALEELNRQCFPMNGTLVFEHMRREDALFFISMKFPPNYRFVIGTGSSLRTAKESAAKRVLEAWRMYATHRPCDAQWDVIEQLAGAAIVAR